MPTPILSIVSYTAAGSGVRYNPSSPWLPRWMGTWRSSSDLNRNILWSGLTYWCQNLSNTTAQYAAGFYGPECVPRLAHVSNYQWTQNYLPTITLTTPSPYARSASVAYNAPDLGTFLYEQKYPVTYVDENRTLWFRNLACVQTTLQAASGYVDMRTVLASDPRIPDTPIILTTQWGEDVFVDNTNSILSGNQLYVGDNHLYTCTWVSSALHYMYTAGVSAYVHVDGIKLQLTDTSLTNVWDDKATVFGVRRKERETNTSLKKKLQHLSFVNDTSIQISAALGTSVSWMWNTRTALNLAASGITAFEAPQLTQQRYVSEKLINYGHALYSTSVPSSGLEVVLYAQSLVPTTEYTLSGNVYVPVQSGGLLFNSPAGYTDVQYKVQQYTLQVSGYYVLSVTPSQTLPDSIYAFGSRKVRVQNKTKRVRIWRWNQVNSVNLGLAEFG